MSEHLTEEVLLQGNTLYLIRIDGKETVIINDEVSAKLAIDSIAASKLIKLDNEYTRTFRTDSIDGKQITISTQNIGVIIDGYVTKTMVIDYIPVSTAQLLKGRHERKTV